MEYNEILSAMTEALESAAVIPLSGKCIVNGDQMRDLVEALRSSLPSEIEEAKEIVAQRERLLTNAQKEAEKKVAMAEERARRMIDDNEITKKVKERANDVVQQANAQARDIRNGASEFADHILRTTEESLVGSINQVRAAKNALRSGAAAQPAQPANN